MAVVAIARYGHYVNPIKSATCSQRVKLQPAWTDHGTENDEKAVARMASGRRGRFDHSELMSLLVEQSPTALTESSNEAQAWSGLRLRTEHIGG